MNESVPKPEESVIEKEEEEEDEDVPSAALRSILTVLAAAVLVVTIVMNVLASRGKAPFSRSMGNVTTSHETCLSPASYTYFAWNPVFGSQVVEKLYSLVLLCRKEAGTGKPLWKLGGAVSVPFLLVSSMGLLLTIAWLFAWDAEQFLSSTLLLALVVVSSTTALIFSLNSYSAASSTLLQKTCFDYHLGRMIVNNYSQYTTWFFFAFCHNLAVYLIHEVAADATTVCVTILSVIPVIMILVGLLPIIAFTESLAILSNPFITYLWVSVGVYVQNSHQVPASVFALIVNNIVVACVLLVFRMVMGVVRWWLRGKATSPGSVAPSPPVSPPEDPTVRGGG